VYSIHPCHPSNSDGAIIVPHGSTVVSHEDVNVDVDRDEVRAVEKNGVPACHGTDNTKTK